MNDYCYSNTVYGLHPGSCFYPSLLSFPIFPSIGLTFGSVLYCI